jgi:4-hydroxybenzoate polyprenyltransferase
LRELSAAILSPGWHEVFALEQKEMTVPLYVDMDGTLLKIETLHEALIALTKKNPLTLFLAFCWIFKGRSFFNRRVFESVSLDSSFAPVNADFLEFLYAERRRGRPLILVADAGNKVAGQLADRLGIFDEILLGDAGVDLSSGCKRDHILLHSGGDFDYAGNAPNDLDIWCKARRAIIVNAPNDLARKVRLLTEVEAEFAPAPWSLWTFAKALRLHQWSKNLLVFVPVLASHQILSQSLTLKSAIAFLAYGLCASSVYVLNDLFDLDVDRRHPRKSKRAFASGTISAVWGCALIPALLVASAGLSALLPLRFSAVLVSYYMITLAYSFFLKRVSTLDIFLLAGLHTLRIIAGSAATGIHLSFWLLAFSMFLFLSLAAVKRVSELVDAKQDADRFVGGRGYANLDIESLSSIGISSGFAAVMVLALYIKSPEVEVMYRHPTLISLLCPMLLYWLSRCWVRARRGNIDDDPIVFAARDGVSRLVLAIAAILVFFAT